MNMTLKLSALTAVLLAGVAQAETTTVNITGDDAQELFISMDAESVETSSGRGFELTTKRSSTATCNELVLLSIVGDDRGEVEKVNYDCTVVVTK